MSSYPPRKRTHPISAREHTRARAVILTGVSTFPGDVFMPFRVSRFALIGYVWRCSEYCKEDLHFTLPVCMPRYQEAYP